MKLEKEEFFFNNFTGTEIDFFIWKIVSNFIPMENRLKKWDLHIVHVRLYKAEALVLLVDPFQGNFWGVKWSFCVVNFCHFFFFKTRFLCAISKCVTKILFWTTSIDPRNFHTQKINFSHFCLGFLSGTVNHSETEYAH